jgi:thiol-disulfide isomerase/thioredoxin
VEVKRIGKRDLQKILGGNVNEPATCVIKFYSNKCHYCHELKDIYEETASEHNDVLFFAFNIEDYPQVQKVMNFKGIPTISLIKTGTSKPRIRLIDEPPKPNKKTWYTKSDISSFIEKEK